MVPIAPRCPLCHTRKSVPIVYGQPTEAQMEQANMGRLHLGGLTMTGEDPNWHCRKCGYKWIGSEALG